MTSRDAIVTAFAEEMRRRSHGTARNFAEQAEKNIAALLAASAGDIVDTLVGMVVLFPSDRWDEDCHKCERRIGDHTIDGRCPLGGDHEWAICQGCGGNIFRHYSWSHEGGTPPQDHPAEPADG